MNELLNKLTKLLKDDIQQNYYLTGALYNSIEFRFENELKLYSEDYIEFLEEGTYLQDFFERNDIKEIIADIYTNYIDGKIEEKLN